MAITIPVVETVPLRVDELGSVRVGGTRVTLDTVVGTHNVGRTAEQIVDSFDVLELADVHAVITYYLRHRDEVDAYIAEGERKADELRRWVEDNQEAADFRERLRAHLAERRATS